MPIQSQPDPAFAEHSSGLLVPKELARERQVWTRDEWKLLNRSTKMLASHELLILLKCQRPSCKDAPLEPKRLANGDFRLRCNHADRVMTKAF